VYFESDNIAAISVLELLLMTWTENNCRLEFEVW